MSIGEILDGLWLFISLFAFRFHDQGHGLDGPRGRMREQRTLLPRKAEPPGYCEDVERGVLRAGGGAGERTIIATDIGISGRCRGLVE